MNIEAIQNPMFLKTLTNSELEALSKDIRLFLIRSLSITGGHLSSNLGVVDLTIALHYVFNAPEDQFIFDVGHQSYTHKILSGRSKQFNTLRKYEGLSGYQKRSESIYDVWEAGHSSTSLSAAHGFAVARDLNNQDHEVIAIIGDGALTGGMALEAINNIGGTKNKVIIILNDNDMSISKNSGGINELMSGLRANLNYNKMKQEYKELMNKHKITRSIYKSTSAVKKFVKKNVVNDSIFGDFGLEYLGPIDGHDYKDMIRAFNKAKMHQGPIVIHVMTQKGRGYKHCENDDTGCWHGVAPFNIKTGISIQSNNDRVESWSKVVSDTVLELMHEDDAIVTITPAMITGSKLETIFNAYPTRSFDTGITEQHAMTFAAALAAAGKKPFISIYSSFLQRAYDQVNHDVARMNLPVFVGIDRAGLVGDDGETHHGVFDISFLLPIPNIVLCMPKDMIEAKQLIHTAFKNNKQPFFMRYPRGSTLKISPIGDIVPIKVGTWEVVYEKEGYKAIIITYGPHVEVVKAYATQQDLQVKIVNARFIKPFDDVMVKQIGEAGLPIFIYETDMKIGSLASLLLQVWQAYSLNVKVKNYGIEDRYISQGTIDQLIEQEHLSIDQFMLDIMKEIE